MAFAHFVITETRPIWILWYTIFSTIETVVTTSSISDAYRKPSITQCLHSGDITPDYIEDCAKSAYTRYLATGPQIPYQECKLVTV